MYPSTFLALNFGALIDMVSASRPPVHPATESATDAARWDEAALATRRAIAMVIAGAYATELYRTAFQQVTDLVMRSDLADSDIARMLLAQHGKDTRTARPTAGAIRDLDQQIRNRWNRTNAQTDAGRFIDMSGVDEANANDRKEIHNLAVALLAQLNL